MTIRHSILTLVVAGLAGAAPAAQAQMLAGDGATTGKKAVSTKSTKSTLSAIQVAGIRYHATANLKNERFLGESTSTGVRPDNRPGVRGI
jgi:hypothetical protein